MSQKSWTKANLALCVAEVAELEFIATSLSGVDLHTMTPLSADGTEGVSRAAAAAGLRGPERRRVWEGCDVSTANRHSLGAGQGAERMGRLRVKRRD